MPSEFTQEQLSEELQLLHFLDPSESRWWHIGAYHANGPRTKEDNIEARMYDAMALFIAGRSPGSNVAVAMDKHYPLTVILAKSGCPPDDADRAHATLLFECFRTARNSSEALDFVLSTTFQTAKKRKRKVANADVTGLHTYLRTYKPTSLEAEFDTAHPFFQTFREACEPGADVNHLIAAMIHALQSPSNEGASGSGSVRKDFKIAIYLAAIFENSAFLKLAGLYLSGCRNTAIRYRRRLEKLAQYQLGTMAILSMRRRYLPPGTGISHRWIGADFMGHAPDPVHIHSSPLLVAQRWTQSVTPESLLSFNARIFDTWADVLHPSIHPELWIICYFHLHILDQGSRLEFQRRIIGCSKRSCLCCVAWIESHNTMHGLMWETSKADGKTFYDWGLSGVQTFDAAVRKSVQNYIGGRLEPFLTEDEDPDCTNQ